MTVYTNQIGGLLYWVLCALIYTCHTDHVIYVIRLYVSISVLIGMPHISQGGILEGYSLVT